METGDTSKDVSFAPTKDGYGVEVLDRIDRHRYILWTPDVVTPETIATDRFSFPVDAAVSITTNAITLPTVVPVYVRDETGSFLSGVEQSSFETFPDGVYCLELAAPIRLYLRVRSGVTASSDLVQTYIEFDDETEVLIGARSYHEAPAATVTTTDDPREMMAAVSTFGSGLETQTPERSLPSNRGHPPTVTLGEELHVPKGADRSDSGIRLEIQPTYRSIYAAAPLAYYLGAELVPAETPRLVTDSGFEYALEGERSFEETVERVLKRIFFLDCLVRTEGVHPVDLHERRKVEPHLDHDLASLYGYSHPERVEAYFDVPYPVIEPQLPDWNATAHVDPVPESIELLPFLAHRLALVHTSRGREISPPNEPKALIEEFLRNGSGTRSSRDEAPPVSYVRPAQTDSLENIWVGDGLPLGANKALLEGYRNRLGRRPTKDDIEITVVYNDIDLSSAVVDVDSNMDTERDLVDEVYGSRSDLPFDVTIHQNLTVDELRSVLRTPTDFLHYIGHIDDEGIRCVDGVLDAATLETAGPDAFFLNACRSYEQGYHLVQGGSIGGIATLGDLIDGEAVKMGQTVARLLNRGFPLYAAHQIAREVILLGGQYIVLGDGGFAITQAESSVANMCEIEPTDSGYEIEIRTYPTNLYGMGTMFIPYVESNDEYFLSGGTLETFELSANELRRFLTLEDVPVRIRGELCWSHDIDIATL